MRPGITTPSRKYLGEQLVNEVHNSEKETLYGLLEGQKVTLQTDGWSSIDNTHAIDKAFSTATGNNQKRY